MKKFLQITAIILVLLVGINTLTKAAPFNTNGTGGVTAVLNSILSALQGTLNVTGTITAPTPLPTAPDNVTEGSPQTCTASSAANMCSFTASGFSQISFHFTSIGAGNSVTVEESNDNTNWFPEATYRIGGASVGQGNSPFTPNTSAIFSTIVVSNYVRLRVSTYSSGTVTAIANFKRYAQTFPQEQFVIYGDGGSGQPVSVATFASSSSTVGITAVSSTALEAGHVLKNTAGNLYSITVTAGATAGFLQLFNSTTVPADGAVTPVWTAYVPASTIGGTTIIFQVPLVFSTGISAAFSTATTPFTKTSTASSYFSAEVK